MLGGSNQIYGRHMIIHNEQFAQCEVWKFSRTLLSKDKDLTSEYNDMDFRSKDKDL